MLQNHIVSYNTKMFEDRVEAGRMLTQLLMRYKNDDSIIFTLPRGGVVVGYEIAKEMDIPLDVLISRKIGAPSNPEFGIGAVSEGNVVLLNDQVIKSLDISKDKLEELIDIEREEVKRRIKLYRNNRPVIPTYLKTVILVDDGLATGVTAEAAIESIKKLKPKQIIFASPICSYQTSKILAKEVDSVVCIMTPHDLEAIGNYYRNFSQVSEEEVLEIIKQNRERQKEKLL